MRRRVEITSVDDDAAFWQDRDTVLSYLRELPPRVPAWFGYDVLGSQLFEEITTLPCYYLTRVERELLERHAVAISERLDHGRIAELGSGSAKKTRLLLAACTKRRSVTYLPIDVSREMLATSGEALAAEFPELRVHGLWGRYQAGLAYLRDDCADSIAVAFLGSNIGNTTPAERAALLAEIAATLRPGDRFLTSADLQKPAVIFETCYNDPLDRSAFIRFRLNYLTHLNQRFNGDFAPHYFYPRAHYNEASATVEAHLYATEDQTVQLRELDLKLELRRGESINVGFSTKFYRPQFVAEISAFGFDLDEQWLDAAYQYGIFLFIRR
jgi:L-histidine N-alpha-methyltransferase